MLELGCPREGENTAAETELHLLFFNSLDDHLAIDGGSDVAVQFVVDDTYSNHNPFHIEDYLSLEIK